MAIKIFTVAEMVAAERAADAVGLSYARMMETAGRRVAEAVEQRYPVAGRQVLALVGPGNNGGDGLVAGRYLAEAGAKVAFYLSRPRDPQTDENLARVRQMGLEVLSAGDDPEFRALRERILSADILIDALLGTGVSRPVAGSMAALMEQVRDGVKERVSVVGEQSHSLVSVSTVSPQSPDRDRTSRIMRVVAVDCPSGLNCDTGALDPLAIPAHLTVTFAGPKRGHFRFPGAAALGELIVADIGIPPDLPEVSGVSLELATADLARALLPARPPDGHKGTFGTALIVAGSERYWGAPALAAAGAFRAGAGLVALAAPAGLRPMLAGRLPEATFPAMPDALTLGVDSAQALLRTATGYPAWLIGPGLGEAGPFVETLLGGVARLTRDQGLPRLVVDADGLNLLAGMPDWPQRLPPGSVLTPHPGEMARLVGEPLSALRDRERVELARTWAAAWGHVMVLKGAFTVIAAPDGRCALLPFANPILAVGGSGDVLGGLIVGLIAQGVEPYNAAVLGGYLHGAAGESARASFGDAGMLAGEIADRVPAVRARLFRTPT